MKNFSVVLMMIPFMAMASNIKEISWGVLVDVKNHQVILQGESNYNRALLCQNIALKYEVSSITTNTVVSNQYKHLKNIFIYPDFNERITSLNLIQDELATLSEKLEDKLIITDASLDLESAYCKLATINNYCDYAQMNKYEEMSLTQMKAATNSATCRDLSRKLWKTKYLNLKNLKIMSYEILSLMPRLRGLNVENSYQDISQTLENLKGVRISGLNKMVPYMQEENSNIQFENILSIQKIDKKYLQPIKNTENSITCDVTYDPHTLNKLPCVLDIGIRL